MSTTAKATSKIIFHFDTVSPWSYVAYNFLKTYQPIWNVELELRPINLGYVMKYSGNRPPISVANKGMWMFQDMNVASKFYKLELNQPKNFPIDTSNLQAVLRRLKDDRPELLSTITEVFFKAIWNHDMKCKTRPEIESIIDHFKVRSLFERQGGSDLDSILEKSFSKEDKVRLAQEAEKLVEEGAFGMPWMIVKRARDGEETKWFGSDRFEQIAAFLEVPYRGPLGNGQVSKI
ncbi:thioredoxin-like protein [Violaceomyces palustris]|uniref:Thioredoxin-like protein n=1 Tax=Violaceomyces palustris TaxID=1673888 RepID=A0ACD0NUU6_9BASI|nr:thioredoxin-like protein [Violaceomyces palustris]